jgi:hypothetical protein
MTLNSPEKKMDSSCKSNKEMSIYKSSTQTTRLSDTSSSARTFHKSRMSGTSSMFDTAPSSYREADKENITPN